MSAGYEDRPWLSLYPEELPASLDYPEKPLCAFLEEAARDFPEHDAAIFFGRRMSFRDLAGEVERFAAALAAAGLGKGDRVALMLPNCPQAIVAYYGALRVGAVVVQISPLAAPREVAFQLEDAGANFLVALDLLVPRLMPLKREGRISRLVVARIADYLPPLLRLLYPLKARRDGQHVRVPRERGVVAWADWLRAAPEGPPQVAIDPAADLALIQYTGGTTGSPKGAMLTHRNLVANTIQAASWFRGAERGKERVLAALPFFHVYGMTVCMNYALLLASTLILLPRFEVDDVLKAINRHRPTLFPGAPPMYVAVNNHPEVGRYDLRSVSACLSGAAPLPAQVQKRFEELTGGRLVEGYGLTEASPVTHCNPLWDRGKQGSIGIPMPDTECRIVDLEQGDTEVPVGERGELIIRGPQVMKGYWNRPEDNARALRDGWLYTGDVATMDEDGYFYIVDRIKEMIITGGFNVYPREVEEVLYEHPAVREAAAIGVPDEYRGEAVKAIVALREGRQVDADELIAFCRERLARYKAPREVGFRDELPKAPAGKVLRRVLAEEETGSATQRPGA